MLNFIVFVLFAVGIGFIIYSVIKFKPVDEKGAHELTQETLDRLEGAIQEADNAMEEISKLSQSIFDEMTEKYKELLYLYSALEKKQVAEQAPQAPVTKNDIKMPTQSFVNSRFNENTISEEPAQRPMVRESINLAHETQENSFMDMFNSENSKHKEIRELYQRGMSVSDIARQLNIGHSEVSLVIQLGKGGR